MPPPQTGDLSMGILPRVLLAVASNTVNGPAPLPSPTSQTSGDVMPCVDSELKF